MEILSKMRCNLEELLRSPKDIGRVCRVPTGNLELQKIDLILSRLACDC